MSCIKGVLDVVNELFNVKDYNMYV